jgi:hypothetical protein
VFDALAGKAATGHNHNLADLTEHSYSSLTDKPTIPTIEDTPTDGHTTIGASSNSVYDHIANTSNPHSVTKAQVGLTNVTDTAQLPASYLETTWTDSDVKVSSSKAMGTKAAALISSHAGANNAHHNPVSIGTANGLSLSTQALSMAASSTSAVGAVQLEDSHTSTSTSKAACPKNVKEAYDLANAALPSANLESSPTNGQTGKAPNSDWAYKIESEACTLSGIKTFNSFPITPSSAPTANYEVANKKYVDDNAGGGALHYHPLDADDPSGSSHFQFYSGTANTVVSFDLIAESYSVDAGSITLEANNLSNINIPVAAIRGVQIWIDTWCSTANTGNGFEAGFYGISNWRSTLRARCPPVASYEHAIEGIVMTASNKIAIKIRRGAGNVYVSFQIRGYYT